MLRVVDDAIHVGDVVQACRPGAAIQAATEPPPPPPPKPPPPPPIITRPALLREQPVGFEEPVRSAIAGTLVRLGQLAGVDLAVHRAGLQQLLVGARVDQLDRACSTRIMSAARTVDRRWAITNVVRPRISSTSAARISRSVGGVDRRRELVQDQDARVHQQRAGDRHALLLTARQRYAALADDACRSPSAGDR